MDVHVDAVPRREPAMAPFEVMTSESQERMLAIVTPGDRAAVEEVCLRWEVRATVIGTVTGGGRLRILDGDAVLADVPAASLSDDAPLYDRPCVAPAGLEARRGEDPEVVLAAPAGAQLGADVLALLADASWVYRQYDHQLFLNTVVGPGEDAAVLRLAAPGLPLSDRGLAISTDSNPRWCAVDPRLGTAMTVAESALNVACAGARPAALVNCLNFGNPEHPEVMWQLSESIDGMAEACLALDIPVIGGNVSLYNASAGTDIDPTPVVAVLGVIDHLERRPPGMAFTSGSTLVLLGDTDRSLAGSRWALECHGHGGGTLPALDLAAHARLLALLGRIVPVEGTLTSIHDISGGGLALALAESALRSGVGCRVDGVADHAELLSESSSRRGARHAAPRRGAGPGGGGRRPGRASSGRRVGTGSWSPVCSTSPWPTPPRRGAWRCPVRWASPSVPEAHPALVVEVPSRVVGDLPGMAVGVDEDARVAAPERRPRFPADRRPRGAGLGDDGVDLGWPPGVVGQGHAAPTPGVLHGGVLGEPGAVPQRHDHARRLEEHDVVVGASVAVPAQRLVEGACPSQIGDSQSDHADALVHGEHSFSVADRGNRSPSPAFRCRRGAPQHGGGGSARRPRRRELPLRRYR